MEDRIPIEEAKKKLYEEIKKDGFTVGVDVGIDGEKEKIIVNVTEEPPKKYLVFDGWFVQYKIEVKEEAK